MSNFKFMQPIQTPHGPGHFIGYFRDGEECQVTRWTQRDGKKICINPVYPIGDITPRETALSGKSKPANKIILVDVASV